MDSKDIKSFAEAYKNLKDDGDRELKIKQWIHAQQADSHINDGPQYDDHRLTANHWVTPLKSAFLSENRLAFVPTFILVDKEGHIQWRKAKAPSNPELRSDLNALFD